MHSQALAAVRTVAHGQIHIHRLPRLGTAEAVLEPHITARPARPYGAGGGQGDTGAGKAHRQQQGHTDPVQGRFLRRLPLVRPNLSPESEYTSQSSSPARKLPALLTRALCRGTAVSVDP